MYYMTIDKNIFPLAVSFSLLLLYSSLFSTMDLKKVFSIYQEKKKYYIRDKLLLYSGLVILVINLVLILLSILLGDIFNIPHLSIINIFMVLYLFSTISIKLITSYLNVVGYKSLSKLLPEIFYISNIIINIILSILLFKVFSIEDYINIIILYSTGFILYIIISILLYIMIFRKRKTYPKEKIKYLPIIKNALITNKEETIYNITTSFYIYFSIIVLDYILINKYHYDTMKVEELLTNTYMYGIVYMYLLFIEVKSYYKSKLSNVLDNIKEGNNLLILINKLLNISLILLIFLSVVSGAINYLLFKTKYNIIISLSLVISTFILYDAMLNISIKYSKKKINLIIIIIGLIVKVVFEIPLINTIYRMGYNQVLGSILSSVLSYIVCFGISLFTIQKKFKVSILSNFNNILNIIYENIIYSLVLVLFTLIVKVNTNSIISSIMVIIFYLFISTIFFIIKKKTKK